MKIFFDLFKSFVYLLFRVNKICERIAEEKHCELMLKNFSYVGQNCKFHYADCFIRGQQYIKIGDNFSVGRCFRMEAIDKYQDNIFSPVVIIGNNVRIEDYYHIGCLCVIG